MKKKKIVVAGSSNTDMIVKTSRIPRPGETVIGGEFSTAAGGKGANQAVAAARAGGDVVFIARVGDDLLGEEALNGFRNDGIDTTYIERDTDAASGVALIIVDDSGENSIAVASGANANLTPDDIARAEQAISSADILLMQLEIPLETVIAAAKIASGDGVHVILNPAPARQLPGELLRCVSILTPNESEAELLTGIAVADSESAREAAKILRDKGIGTVLITMGAGGVYVSDETFEGIVPGFTVKAMDTTAAGDVFNGALAVALAGGKELREAVRFANAAAALSVTRLGAQPSAPSLGDIEAFITRQA